MTLAEATAGVDPPAQTITIEHASADATSLDALPDGVSLGHLRSVSDRRSIRSWMHTLDGRTERAVRRALLALAVFPALIVVAWRFPHVSERGIIGVYGIAVILSTASIFYLAFVRYRDPAEMAVPPTVLGERLVSFFIPVKNEQDNIEQCVRSVLDSTYRNIELFVIDDGSTDGTRAVLERIADCDRRLTVLCLDVSIGKKAALVTAARHASGEYFVFTDSDCWLAPDAIVKCIAAFGADPELGGMSGHARALNADHSFLTRIQDVWYDGQFSISKAAESSFGSVSCVSGPLAAFRREAIINYLPAWASDRFVGQPFLFATDRQLTAYVLGQQWVGEKLKALHADDPLVADEPHEPRAWKVLYARSARVWTNVPESPRSFLRQQVRWKKSFIRNTAFNSSWMWRRGPVPAALYYGHVLWVTLAPVMVFLHLVWWPLHGYYLLTALYLAGVAVKGLAWGAAYRVQNPGDPKWIYRPLMTLISAVMLSWLIIWSALTLRRSVWSRG